jgi:Tfp pilus assembly protein FimV
VAAAIGGTGLAVLALMVPLRPRVAPAPDDPRAAVAYWQARDNAWRARGAALAWARLEKATPGEGHLALARLDWELGEREKAQRAVTQILEHGEDAAVRARAASLRDSWDRP